MRVQRLTVAVLGLGFVCACADSGSRNGATAEPTPTPAATPTGTPAATPTATPDPSLHFTVVTFNVGAGSSPSGSTNGGYTPELAEAEAEFYGHGLAWPPAIEATRLFMEANAPDIVAFQELFHSDDCPSIPDAAKPGLVCETWQPGDPTVVQTVMGANYQIACSVGHSDNCLAVKRTFGSIAGCDADFCLEGLAGAEVETCGNGSRVGRAVIDLVGGGSLTLVEIHGSSGMKVEDMGCRVKQMDQVWSDLGLDGTPGANGLANVVLGDFNTDPGRIAWLDPSAAEINKFVGDGLPYRFVTEVGPDVPPTYAGLFNIDLVMSDAFSGTCWASGVTDGHPDVLEGVTHFDHRAIVCTLDGVRPGDGLNDVARDRSSELAPG